jgi:U3 small nucleolar ribonucleoprotein component
LVPTVTAESTQSLEDKIKSRIINKQWDDVERKLEFDPKSFLPSQLLDISATPSGKSLAELYEDEYSAERQRAEGKDVTDERDSKLKAKHVELEGMFENICAKLDALSNTHFTPKAVRCRFYADETMLTYRDAAQDADHFHFKHRQDCYGICSPCYYVDWYPVGA